MLSVINRRTSKVCKAWTLPLQFLTRQFAAKQIVSQTKFQHYNERYICTPVTELFLFLCTGSPDPWNSWLSFTARLPRSPPLSRSGHQFHMHLLLHGSAHCTDREVCVDRIWKVSLPITHHLNWVSNHRHRLLYPFRNLGSKFGLFVCSKNLFKCEKLIYKGILHVMMTGVQWVLAGRAGWMIVKWWGSFGVFWTR